MARTPDPDAGARRAAAAGRARSRLRPAGSPAPVAPAPPQEPAGPSSPVAVPGARTRRRDRHGRGPRGPLMPADLPAARTRAEAFDDLVLDAVEHLERWWSEQLSGVEFAVEDVPPPPDAASDEVALGRCLAAGPGHGPPRVVVYRRPVLARAEDEEDLAALVHEVVVEQVAVALGRTPEEIDPRPPA